MIKKWDIVVFVGFVLVMVVGLVTVTHAIDSFVECMDMTEDVWGCLNQ